MNSPTRPTLLGVWAHPDDEAYLSAGLMAEFVQRGGRVVVVMATYGERGTDNPNLWPPSRLGPRRERELADSLAVLGVDEMYLLGFPDGGCDRFDGTARVAEHIERIQPDLIVTFGPDGLTGHADHRAVSEWTTDARAVARPQADLWFATVTDSFHATWGAINETANFFFPNQPDMPRSATGDLVHHATLADDVLSLKVRALAAHASQTAELIDRIGVATYREWWRTESFRRAPASSSYLRIAQLAA